MNIEAESLVIFAVELFDGLGCATRSIFNVFFVVWLAEADEVEFLVDIFRALTLMKGGNVAEGSEKLLDLFVSHVGRQVFDENVVEGLSNIGFALRVEFNSDEVIVSFGGVEGSFGVFGVLEANESITTRLVILAE